MGGHVGVLWLIALAAGMLLAGLSGKSKTRQRIMHGIGYGSLLLLLMVVGARLTADPAVWASFTGQWYKGVAVGIGATAASLLAGRLFFDVSKEEDG